MDKSELNQELGFDPALLDTPEMDLYRFGFYGDNPPECLKSVLDALHENEPK